MSDKPVTTTCSSSLSIYGLPKETRSILGMCEKMREVFYKNNWVTSQEVIDTMSDEIKKWNGE